jgi:hypothetical protein
LPFVESDAAEARLAQRHQRVFLDPAAEVSGLGLAHDLTRVAVRPMLHAVLMNRSFGAVRFWAGL